MKFEYRNLYIIMLIFVISLFTGAVFAQDFSLTAQTDKDTVAFGDSLTLVVQVSQSIGSGANRTIRVPNIKSIPNFDIASTRSSQSQQWINGVGRINIQMIYELVPQKPGTFTIPSFSMDMNGKNYQTDAIQITVQPPPEEKSEDSDNSDAAVPDKSSGLSIFQGIMIFAFIVSLIVAIPILLSMFMNKDKKNTGWAEAKFSDQDLVSKKDKILREDIEEAEISPVKKEHFDFDREVERLKKTDPEINNGFYRTFFDLFRKAVINRKPNISEDMTPDEILNRLKEDESLKLASNILSKIGNDIDMVLYANSIPTRSFSEIEKDIKDILEQLC